MLTDRFNRSHTYLRISLTDNCNLRCFYCMPEEDYSFTPAASLMQADEIESLARIFVDQGVDKIRLTGGEPLVRKDAKKIILALSKLPVSLTLTTNGTLLHEFADLLQDAGVRSLNISLDTLQPDRFMLLTRRDRFDRVKKNIDLMLEKGFVVKVNAVIMKGMNDDEIIDFVAWTKDNPVHVRFIEFMPFSGNHWNSHRVFSMHEMVDKVRQVYQVDEMPNRPHDTARLFAVPGHAGTFAIIATMTAPFCAGCNRIRLTADGKIKNCLFSKEETNLLAAFRRGEDLLPLIRASIHSKARELGGQFSANPDKVEADKIHNRSMITIGG